uniref:Uncharacterized protein n=1 Tax=Daphnia galeata TaxID=27404 RepID=A0A8J2RXV5_9CRUS|nr:unnamed protein product [Daphnia galeata]
MGLIKGVFVIVSLVLVLFELVISVSTFQLKSDNSSLSVSGKYLVPSKLGPIQQTPPKKPAVQPAKPTKCSGNKVFNTETGSCQNRVG